MEKLNLETNSQIPIYQQVADWIQEQILKGIWNAGDKIPSEEEFVKSLNCSRGTIRKAISILAEEDILTKTQGKGTFITKDKISYPFAQRLTSFSESMQEKDINYTTKVIGKEIIFSDSFLQKKLCVSPQEKILFIKRIRYIDDMPAIYLKNYLSIERFKGIEKENFEDVSLFEAMEEIMGTRIAKGVRDFSASLVNEEISSYLKLDINSPILQFDQLTFDNENSPIEYSRIYLRSDKYQVTSILSR